MAKLILASLVAFFCFALTCNAATYIVGDTSGWDISTNLDSWDADKTFQVGDVLVFQYSSSNSISGNRLYCLGGMKLPVNVQDDGASSPVAAPQGQPGAASNPQPSSKSNNPATVIPNSAVPITAGIATSSMAFLCFTAITTFLLQS